MLSIFCSKEMKMNINQCFLYINFGKIEMKTTGLIAIVFGYHKKSQQTLGLSTGNFVKKTGISGYRIGRSVPEWRKILYRIGNRIGHFFGIGAPLVEMSYFQQPIIVSQVVAAAAVEAYHASKILATTMNFGSQNQKIAFM